LRLLAATSLGAGAGTGLLFFGKTATLVLSGKVLLVAAAAAIVYQSIVSLRASAEIKRAISMHECTETHLAVERVQPHWAALAFLNDLDSYRAKDYSGKKPLEIALTKRTAYENHPEIATPNEAIISFMNIHSETFETDFEVFLSKKVHQKWSKEEIFLRTWLLGNAEKHDVSIPLVTAIALSLIAGLGLLFLAKSVPLITAGKAFSATAGVGTGMQLLMTAKSFVGRARAQTAKGGSYKEFDLSIKQAKPLWTALVYLSTERDPKLDLLEASNRTNNESVPAAKAKRQEVVDVLNRLIKMREELTPKQGDRVHVPPLNK
jgi:hypothetical protein